MIDIAAIRARFTAMVPFDERTRRLLAASEARTAGRGGITAASSATGVARSRSGVGWPSWRRGGTSRRGVSGGLERDASRRPRRNRA
jgi:hypothetical protein